MNKEKLFYDIISVIFIIIFVISFLITLTSLARTMYYLYIIYLFSFIGILYTIVIIVLIIRKDIKIAYKILMIVTSVIVSFFFMGLAPFLYYIFSLRKKIQ